MEVTCACGVSEDHASPGWCRALEVLEGGPLRMRRAVDLAGLALDATDAADAATG